MDCVKELIDQLGLTGLHCVAGSVMFGILISYP